MLQSFFIYITAGILLFILGNISYKRSISRNLINNKKTSFWSLEILLLLLVFATLSGLRWNVGVDYLEYLNNFNRVGLNLEGRFTEISFKYFTRLLAINGIHFSFYFGIISFFQLYFIYKLFQNEKYLYPFLAIIILFGPEFLSWMNGIRQMLAATIFVWSIQFIKNKEFIKYLLVILFASTIHLSAIVLISIYFIPSKDIYKKRGITVLIFIATIFFGFTNYLIQYFSELEDILNFIGYDNYSSKMNILIHESQPRSIGPRRISIILVILVLIGYSKQLKYYFREKYFLICYNLTITGFLLYNLLSQTHHVLLRPVAYLTIFLVPTCAYLLYFLYRKKIYNLFIITLFLVISYLPITLIADLNKGDKDYSNYKLFWYNNKEN